MRSKKILSLICSAALAVSAVALPIGGRPIFNDLKVSAEQADYEVYEYFNDGDWQCGFAKEEGKTRVWITGCNNTKATKLVVPSMVRGYRVTRILDFTTGGSTEMEMTDLTIPSSITYIKRAAFWQQCNKLKEIHVINNPRFEFKNGILYGRNLTKETGEKYEVYYNDEAHYYDMNKRVIKVCNQARQVEIEEGVDIIDNKAFDGLENLEHVVLPAGIKVIDDAAFLNCINLQEVTIPYGCEVIGASAFGGNLEMRNINLPSTLKYIGAGAFGSLPKLKSVYVPDSVEYIGSGAFTMDYDDGKGSKVTVYGNYKEPNEDGSVDDPIEEYCDRDNRAEYAPATDKDGNFIVDVTHDPDDPYDHFYIYAVNIKPTCTTPGALAGICFCGHTYYQPLPATGHAFALQGVDADGTAHYKCAVCGEEKTVKTGLVMNVMDKITSKETHDYSALEITVFDKDGAIAGPKVMEHIVDAVLYFEGERHQSYRILRAVKNRFGSTNEIGVFEMIDKGLREVDNPSQMLLEGRPHNVSGTCVACVMEGSRPILAEVQALAAKTSYSAPRRMVTGFDFNRLNIIIAVLEKRLGIFMGSLDVYLNIVGGFRLDEPAGDLPVAMALYSGIMDKQIDEQLVAFGEIGLGGEIRSVSHISHRIREAERMGFKTCVIPKQCMSAINAKDYDIEIIAASTLKQAFAAIK